MRLRRARRKGGCWQVAAKHGIIAPRPRSAPRQRRTAMTIARVLSGRDGEVVSCEAGTPVSEAVKLLAERRIGALPVLDGGQVVGIFSERDVVYRLQRHGAAMLDCKVGEVMTAPAITVTPETKVLEALALMTRRRFRHLPVIEGGRMVGIVSIGDLVKYRIDHVQSEAEALRSYIQMA
jgi:CBS domain-containing protein